jgi:hypothetical protein
VVVRVYDTGRITNGLSTLNDENPAFDFSRLKKLVAMP